MWLHVPAPPRLGTDASGAAARGSALCSLRHNLGGGMSSDIVLAALVGALVGFAGGWIAGVLAALGRRW